MPRSLYDLMMISPSADRELITVVYRHLAKRLHPDKDPSPDAAARMMALNEAYAILSDTGKRARYDEILGIDTGGGSRGGENAPERSSEEAQEPYGESGPPPANPAPRGSSLTFGRYRGWTLNQVGRYDRDYLEWLSRTTMGRNYRHELEQLLLRQG